MDWEKTHSLKDYVYYNVGPLNGQHLKDHEFKPTESKYENHYKYFSYLYKFGRITPEQGIVKFVAPQAKFNEIVQVDYEQLFNKEINVDLQIMWPKLDENATIQGAYVCVQDKARRSLDFVFDSDRNRRLGAFSALDYFMKTFWNNIAEATQNTPHQSLCASYVDERDLDFTPVIDLKQSLDMLNAVSRREDVHFPKMFIGSCGAFSSKLNDDFDLLTVNIMYCGRPKVYYIIPPSQFDKYVQLVRQKFHRYITSRSENNCFIIPPQVLDEAGIKYITMAQNPGDIIYIFGKTIWFSINTGPSMEQVTSCGHYLWGKSIISRVSPNSFNVMYNTMHYEEKEIEALQSFVRYQEAIWLRNRDKRIKIKSQSNYLEKRREYDKRAKSKQTAEMRQEQIRRRMIGIVCDRIENPEKKPKRRTAPSRYVVGMIPKNAQNSAAGQSSNVASSSAYSDSANMSGLNFDDLSDTCEIEDEYDILDNE